MASDSQKTAHAPRLLTAALSGPYADESPCFVEKVVTGGNSRAGRCEKGFSHQPRQP